MFSPHEISFFFFILIKPKTLWEKREKIMYINAGCSDDGSKKEFGQNTKFEGCKLNLRNIISCYIYKQTGFVNWLC